MNIVARALALLQKNPILFVPGLIVAVLVAALHAFALSVSAMISIIAYVVMIVFVTAMSGAMWQTGRTRLADGAATWNQRFLPLLYACIGIAVIGALGLLAAPLTRGLSILIVAVLVIYTLPAVIVGARSASAAFVESFRLAVANLGASAGIGIAIIVINILASLVGHVFLAQPDLAAVAGGIVRYSLFSVLMLVVVGIYLDSSREAVEASPKPRV